MSTVDQDPPIHLLGSPAFFPALITYIRSLSSSSQLPVDQVIVKSVLLCLIAGDKHLILRTAEEDIGLVVKLVSWTLAAIFNYPTHRVKIRSRSSPRHLSESLFLLKGGGPGKLSRTGTKLLLTPKYSRSTSYPNDMSHALSPSSDSQVAPDSDFHEPPISRLHHSYTEPAPAHLKQDFLELPRALILSGIERASVPVQHELAKIISERRVAIESVDDGCGVWGFPSGFIAIYVCSISSNEHPSVHKSLLDKFSMSHNVFISQSIRNALQSLSFSPVQSFSHSPSFCYSNSDSPTFSYQSPLPQTQTPPYFNKPLSPVQPIRHHSTSNPPVVFVQDPIPQTFIDNLQIACQKTHLAPELGLYLSDLFSATRHHPCLDGMLLTARARKDAEDLARAARVIGSDLTGMELVRPVANKDDDASEYFDAQSTRYLRTTDESSTTNLIRKDSIYGSLSRISSMGLDADRGDDVGVFDVTEVDIARTMPRVVTHRLSLRGGPAEEVLASAVVGATFGRSFSSGDSAGPSEEWTDEAKGYGSLTIKDVLVDILNKV